MGDPATLPWINGLGELAHPDAPRGGGGPGASRNPRPAGTDAGTNPRSIPSPDSSAGRHLTPIELSDKVGDGDPKTPADIEKEKQQANLNLSIYVTQASEEMVGRPSVGRKECFDLLDTVLKNLGAKSANDFERVTGRRDQDYKWGDLEPDQDKIRPGDMIQFRNFKTTYTPDRSDRGPYEMIRGPQHSAILIAKNADGSLTIVEQHVMDREENRLSEVIKRNQLDYKAGQRKLADGSSLKIEVSGTIWFYHPVAKPKENKVKTPR